MHTRVSMIAITREGKRRLRGIYVGGGFLNVGMLVYAQRRQDNQRGRDITHQ